MSSTRASSTGLVQSAPSQLDRHYRSAQVEYEGALRSVGIEPGWTVLDAGCGGGSFLPMLSDLVGPNGSLIALDLAPENIGRIDQWAQETGLSSRLRTYAASITSMPLDDATVDCVWSANVMQYLSEPEAKQAITEMKRVLKPGGLLAVKDFDASLINWSPFDQDLRDRFMIARRQNFLAQGVLGTFYGPGIPARLRAAGLSEIQRKTYLVERWAPLSGEMREGIGGLFRLFAKLSEEYGLPADDVRAWNDLAAAPDRLLHDPDCCIREGFVLAVARKP